MDAIFENGRPRTPNNWPQPGETAEQVPVLAIAKRFIEAACPKELRVPDQHNAAVDDEIASEQIVQYLAARLAPPKQHAASSDAASTGIDPLIVSVDGNTIVLNVFKKLLRCTGNEAIVGVKKNYPAALALLRGDQASNFREPKIAGGGDASSGALDQGHPLVANASHNFSRPVRGSIVDDDHPLDAGLVQRAGNGGPNELGAVFYRDDDVNPHGYLHLARKRRDVPEQDTRERSLKYVSNVRARGEVIARTPISI
jgi:hypothetical protein